GEAALNFRHVTSLRQAGESLSEWHSSRQATQTRPNPSDVEPCSLAAICIATSNPEGRNCASGPRGARTRTDRETCPGSNTLASNLHPALHAACWISSIHATLAQFLYVYNFRPT